MAIQVTASQVAPPRVTRTSLAEVAEEWDLLADRVGASPFTRPGWVGAWQEAFGGPAVTVLVARDADRVVGVLPVQSRLGLVHSPTNWETPSFGLLAEDPEVARELVTAAVEAARWQVQLEFLSDDDAALALSTAADLGWSRADYVMQTSPYLGLVGTFEDYRASLSRNTRKQLNRARRDAEAVGRLDLEVHSHLDEEAYAAFLRLEGSGWKEAQGTSIGSGARESRFYREIAEWAAGRGWLRLVLLRLDGEPVAADLALECGGEHLVLKTGYAPAQERLAPGRLLREASIERAFEQGLDTYELLGSDARWKRSWCSTAHDRHRVAAFRPGLTGRVLRLVHVRGRPVARDLIHQWRAWRGRR